MDPNVRELLDLVFRWVHVIAGIMWVGNSMLFNWLDRNLVNDGEAKGPRHEGTIWMVHSGGFYEVEKKQLAPSEMPATLHWFKWQAYITWMTGFVLLLVVYYGAGGTFLTDPSVASLHPHLASTLGIGSLFLGFTVYDGLWRSPLAKHEKVLIPLSIALGVGLVFALTHLLSGRAAFIHVGATIGSLMAGNVAMHIIPSQRVLVAATKAGQPQDKAFARRAKQRSIHNNYLTFPLIFTMISNHFPSTYGHKQGWLVLLVIITAGAVIRHFMNIRFTFPGWKVPLVATGVVGAGLVFWFFTHAASQAATAPPAGSSGEKVSFSAVRLVVAQRCIQCHSATPTDDVFKTAPTGIMMDTPEQIHALAERIKTRAVISKTMPLANKTHMTQEERDMLGQWVFEGAKMD